MSMKRIAVVLGCALLTACAQEGDDLRAWMKHEAKGLVGVKLEPLPEMQIFPTVQYEQGGEMDPFHVARIQPEQKMAGGEGPDMNRPREPLEAYPLESLTMVGTLMQGARAHALVSVDGRLHQIAVGNYLGQEHGLVTDVRETEIVLTEVVQDINGDWAERVSRLLLQEH
ncbi:MAG TPA: pilus assembly protein PilP [Azoarcus sp.]|nr:pilus assembly protein PilP [Azoarcus sp.]